MSEVEKDRKKEYNKKGVPVECSFRGKELELSLVGSDWRRILDTM
jgi:hypothetical protein